MTVPAQTWEQSLWKMPRVSSTSGFSTHQRDERRSTRY
jgi:hypothetical protein